MVFSVDENLKNDYLAYILEEYGEHNARLGEFILKATDAYEHKVKGSVYNFNRDNMLALLGSLNPTSINNLIVYKSALMQYLMKISDETSSIGLISLKNISTDELKEVLNAESRLRRYLTKQEYFDFLEESREKVNVQDLAIVVLLWNGIKGTGYIDLRSKGIGSYNKKTGVLKHNKREIQLDPIEQDIIFETIKKAKYHNLDNQKTKENESKTTKNHRGAPFIYEYELPSDNRYIIKPLGYTPDGMETDQKIKIRLLKMFKYLKNPFLTGVGIYTSGCIYRMLEDFNFEPQGYTDIREYMKENGYKVAACKLSELQEIMMDKITKPKDKRER